MTDPFEELTALRKSHHELIDLLKKSLANPPNYTINSEKVAEILAMKIPNPVDIMSIYFKSTI